MPNWDLGLRGGSKAHPEQKERGASSEGPAECQGNQGDSEHLQQPKWEHWNDKWP